MPPIASISATRFQHPDSRLRTVAEKLETQFLAEMLKSAGVGKPQSALGGGAGEDHFSSFLTQEYAAATVKVGGIGLAEAIFQSLVQKESVR